MTDAPITHEAKVKLESLIMDGDVRGATNQVLADMRTLERNLNAAKAQLACCAEDVK